MKSNLREQLPYIGSVGQDGLVIINVYRLKDCPDFLRPDYEEFKRTVYNSEQDCASVLLGCCVNTLDRVAETQAERRKKIVQESFPDQNYEFQNLKHLSDAEWRAYNDIRSLILDIKKMLVDGRMMEELKGYSYQKESSDIDKDSDLFNIYPMFHSLYFLEWAEKNFFKIPDELKICRDSEGLLKYSDSKVHRDLRQIFPKHPKNKPQNEDPLFVAVEARAALMDGLIEDIPACDARTVLETWVETNYPKISKRQRPHIAAIVNDGHGAGGSTLFKYLKK